VKFGFQLGEVAPKRAVKEFPSGRIKYFWGALQGILQCALLLMELVIHDDS
jgi:hypothetical protein